MSIPEQISVDEKPCFWCNTKRSNVVQEHLSPHATWCPQYRPYIPPSIPFPISAPKSYGRIAYEAYNMRVRASIGPGRAVADNTSCMGFGNGRCGRTCPYGTERGEQVSKAKKEPVLCAFCNHEKRFHRRGTGPCESNGIHCVIDCKKFQAPIAAKVKYPYVIYLQHKEEVGRVVAEDVYAESKHAWQCAARNSVVASYYPKELWDVITKEQFELLLMTAAERAKVEAKTPLPLPRKIFLQHKRRPKWLVAETLREDREDMWCCGGGQSYYGKDTFQEITEAEYNNLMARGAENTTTGSQRTVFLSQLITGKVIAEVLYLETGSFWLCGDTGEREYSKKEWVKISGEAYRHDAALEDVPEDDPCECGLEGCKRCRPEEENEIFYPNTYRVTLDITTRQAITLQDVARLLDTKKIATPFVGAEVVSIARRE